MQERAFANEKIKFLWNSEVLDVVGESKVEALLVRDVRTDEESRLDVTGLFVAIGHDPRSELFERQIRRDDEGYILVDSPSTRTNLAGVFACGDVVDHSYRQAVTAAGTGCSAALDAERYLTALEDAEATGDPAQVAQASVV
jgi:thioredoxin reductase (NADPH)